MSYDAETVLQEVLNPNLNGDVIIYGAGVNCVDLLITLTRREYIGRLNIRCIVDADKRKQGGDVLGFPIVAPEALAEYDKNAAVIITPANGGTAIRYRLERLGFSKFVYTSRHKADQYLTESIMRNQYTSQKAYWDKALEANRDVIAQVRSALADDTSRDIMDAFFLARFSSNDFSQLERHARKPEYYPEDIIKFDDESAPTHTHPGEVFVDCGAYNGRSAYDFTQRCPNYAYIYSFEPDPMQYEHSRAYIDYQKMQRIELFNMGVWSGGGEIAFNSTSGGGSGILDEHITFGHKFKTRTITVKTVSLDELLYQREHRPTYIKMDVEGAELEALKGAVKIITRDKPRLAICVYHKPADIWEIPHWIMSHFPHYSLYLRQHASHTDTVLYAI